MNGKYLAGAVVEAIIKVIVIAAVVLFVFRTSTAAYDFGYRVFADEPVSATGGRTIAVGIAQDASVKDVAQMLQEKGLVEDAKLFVIQELLSAYHGKILPGIYDLSTAMTAEEMLKVMSTPAEETEEGRNQENRTQQKAAGTEEEAADAQDGNTEGMSVKQDGNQE